ncbi:hypothetical protein [Bacillus sp. T33-2]|uniref:hypothetical protein n=1 Tax=Bacillus sp. T33-2 TaxID=2054168 RepID=UPI000C780440|nr:hypothetical protein [Bacillus sp. T33-2]PLR93175.1 hypothetical protein CVD19_19400 [Bacillus sp. T33-2]
MRIRLEFLFNMNRLFIDQDLPNLNHYFDDIVYSSNDLLVYKESDLVIMISKEGAVSIETEICDPIDLNNKINRTFNEYKKLTFINDRFKLDNDFVIIVPKESTKELVDELGRLHFDVNITQSRNNDLLSVERSIIN